MKVTVTMEFSSEEEAVDYLKKASGLDRMDAYNEGWAARIAFDAKNAPAASPPPDGKPAPAASAQPPVPQQAPAPTPMPAPPPAGNGADAAVTYQQVMGAMADYAKTHKAAGVKNVMSHCKIAKVTEATPEQLIWLMAAFTSNQPYALAT